MASWLALSFFPSDIWPISGRVSEHQDEWVSTNSYVISRIVKTGRIPLQNYSSAAFNSEHIWPLAGTLKSLCCMEISILVVVIWDLIFITLFLAAIKFHFHQLCFLSEKKSLRKYSKHCSQQSSQVWIIFNSQEVLPPLFCIIVLSLKWQFLGKTYLFEKKGKDRVHSAFFPLWLCSSSSFCLNRWLVRVLPTHSFIQHIFPEHLPVSRSYNSW